MCLTLLYSDFGHCNYSQYYNDSTSNLCQQLWILKWFPRYYYLILLYYDWILPSREMVGREFQSPAELLLWVVLIHIFFVMLSILSFFWTRKTIDIGRYKLLQTTFYSNLFCSTLFSFKKTSISWANF